MSADAAKVSPTDAFVHWCESCGREELPDSNAASTSAGIFRPRMGAWGVISPRTCPNCTINKTAWWAIAIEGHSIDEMTPQQRMAVGRILDEVPHGAGM